MSSNNDIYREPIEQEDLGSTYNPSGVSNTQDEQDVNEDKEEIIVNKEPQIEKPVEEKNYQIKSIKEQAIKEEDTAREELLETDDLIPETIKLPENKEEVIEEIKLPEKLPKQEEEPIIEIKLPEKAEEVIEEIKLPEKKEKPVEEIDIPEKVVKEEIKEPKTVEIKEEVVMPQQDFMSLYKELWAKVNPSIAENSEDKARLTDIAVKITILKEDLEDKEITEEEAIAKIQELM
jgi:hypothetical protein